MTESTSLRPLSREETQFKRLMTLWTIVFGLGAAAFFLFGNWILLSGNWIGVRLGLDPMPLPVERFWLSLTVSLMVTLTALCYYIQKDVQQNKLLTSFVLISKATSTVAFLLSFFLDHHYFNYLLGSVFCDGPIFVITYFFYKRAVLSTLRCEITG